jgi:hypothetical protein
LVGSLQRPGTIPSRSLASIKEAMAIPVVFVLVALWILGVFYDWPSMGPYIHVLPAVAVLIIGYTLFMGQRGQAKE